MTEHKVFPLGRHVKHCLRCPNPLCDIRTSHDYHAPCPPQPITEGVPQLVIERFEDHDPFPKVNCWKIVSSEFLDPERKPWVHLSEGYGTVRLQYSGVERRGWALYEAIAWEGGLATRVALRKRRLHWWKWW